MKDRTGSHEKPRLSFWQIWNMSFGFLGIQFGWGLQLANMSGIYTYLGANPDDIPILWLAGPVTGLLIQPIIGSMSDRTWNRLGRRRPYFLVGAILASIALFFMPDSSALWMAAGLLWILDASINVSMEPFRAFVADKLNTDQRTAGFVMQSFFIGIGQSLANALPYLFRRYGFDERGAAAAGEAARTIPASSWPCSGLSLPRASIRPKTWRSSSANGVSSAESFRVRKRFFRPSARCRRR